MIYFSVLHENGEKEPGKDRIKVNAGHKIIFCFESIVSITGPKQCTVQNFGGQSIIVFHTTGVCGLIFNHHGTSETVQVVVERDRLGPQKVEEKDIPKKSLVERLQKYFNF